MASGGGTTGPFDRQSLGLGLDSSEEPNPNEVPLPERRRGGILSSPDRPTLRDGEIPQTSVDCPHAAQCAGCPLIEQDYVRQLATKRARVVRAISPYPALELVYTSPTVPADSIVGYRTRAKLVVSSDGRIGLYDRGGRHEVVDIPSCRVLAPALALVAAELRRLIGELPDELRPLLQPFSASGGVLRAVDLREVCPPEAAPRSGRGGWSAPGQTPSTSVLATLVLQRDRVAPRDELKAAAAALRHRLPGVVGLAVSLHEGETPQILGSETIPLDGVAHAADTIGAVWHLATFGSFVQAHRDQASRVHATILREVSALELGGQPGTDRSRTRSRPAEVLDLYGGSGAISLALAQAGEHVVMVESFQPAAQAARAAAEAQAIRTLDVRPGDVTDLAQAIVQSRQRFDAVIVNPPRRGVSPAARDAIARIGAPLLVYVSCEPDTLARDLDHFSRLGYQPGELLPLDMIPLTEEVETIAVLRRAPVAVPLVIYEDHELVVVDKASHEAIEPTRDHASSLLSRCARLPGVTSLIPVNEMDPGVSGVCVFARSPDLATAWQAAFANGGRLIYLAAAKGITPAKGAVTRDLREGGRAFAARTRYRRLAVASGHSILRVIPEGMRPHQIRRHLAAIGHPILGDDRFGHTPTNRYFEEKHGLDRPFLHLVRIEAEHPLTGQKVLFESTLPADLRTSVERAAGPSVLRFLEQKHALGDHRNSSIPPALTGSVARGSVPNLEELGQQVAGLLENGRTSSSPPIAAEPEPSEPPARISRGGWPPGDDD